MENASEFAAMYPKPLTLSALGSNPHRGDKRMGGGRGQADALVATCQAWSARGSWEEAQVAHYETDHHERRALDAAETSSSAAARGAEAHDSHAALAEEQARR
jgi:hypothetical protein